MPTLPSVIESDALVPDQVMGYVSVTSQGGTSLLEGHDLSDSAPYEGSSQDQSAADHAADACGLQVVAESPLGRSVVGPAAAFEELTGGRVVPLERLCHTRANRRQ